MQGKLSGFRYRKDEAGRRGTKKDESKRTQTSVTNDRFLYSFTGLKIAI